MRESKKIGWQGVAITLLVPCIACIGLNVCLPGVFLLVPSDAVNADSNAPAVAALVFGTLLLGLSAVVLLALLPVVWWRRRLERSLLAAFEAHSFEIRRLYLSGFQGHGSYRGRHTSAWWYTSLRRPIFELFLEGTTGTRIGLHEDIWANRRSTAERMEVPGLEFMLVMPEERRWADAVFREPGVVTSIQQLLAPTGVIRTLFIRPDGILVRLHGGGAMQPDAEFLGESLASLHTILEAAEKHRPSRRLEPTEAEKNQSPKWGAPGGPLAYVYLMLFPLLVLPVAGLVLLIVGAALLAVGP